jgi:hypothetical protein
VVSNLCCFAVNREHGGTVFGLLFATNDKEKFALSEIVMGEGLIVIKPVLEGEWFGMRVLSSPEPSLTEVPSWDRYLPLPFPDTVSALSGNNNLVRYVP